MLTLKNMIYFYLEINMENQINVGNQNTKQIGQNPINRLVQILEKAKVNLKVVGVIIFVCLVIFGIGGFYLGKEIINP